MKIPQTFHENPSHQIFYLRMMTKIALMDDHTIFPDTLTDLVNDLTGFRII
jgi:hypothetical protein